MNRKTALKLVCIGGGTGLSTLLRGLKCYINDNRKSNLVSLEDLTAIVSVSDDGGSSGKLIDEFGVLPPGDIRNCLVALSDEAQVMTKLFEYRFDGNGSLAGHSVGNLLLCALAKLNNDSFPKAIQVASSVLAVKGKILPATLEGTLLCAELADGEVIRGESLIPKRGNREPIKRVYLEPRTNGHSDESIVCAVASSNASISVDEHALCVGLVKASINRSIEDSNAQTKAQNHKTKSLVSLANRKPLASVNLVNTTSSSHLETPLPKANMNFVCEALDEAVEAIKQADAVILGPGSLYTSIIPNLLVNGIAEALKHSNATKILVCNVMNEPGETDNYSISDYVRAITNHADFKLDYVLANNKLARKELLDQYIGEQLAEQFAGIMQYASEAIATLQVSPSKGDADFEKLSTISARIKALSNTIGPVKSANSVQVLFEAKREHLENIKLHEEDMLCEDEIVERGTRKTVLRHRPEKLAQALINLLTASTENESTAR